MAGPSNPVPPTAETLQAAKQKILEALSLSDETIAALATLLIPKTPKITEHAAAIPDKECAICNYTCGEPRDEELPMEMLVTLPCNHNFGMRCLAKAAQRVKTCPMCRGEIPEPIVADLVAVYQNQKRKDSKPAHLGASCRHSLSQDTFDEREYLPDDADEMNLFRPATSFDYEYAMPHGHTAGFTYLLCPKVIRDQKDDTLRKAHMDEIVVTIHAAEVPSGVRSGASKFVYAVWYGPNRISYLSKAENRVDFSTSRDRSGAFVEAAAQALKDLDDLYELGALRRGGRVILKTTSCYFGDAFTDYLDIWKNNGFVNLQGRPVRNKQIWQDLDELIEKLRTEYQTTVHSWDVEDDFIQPMDAFIKATSWTWCEDSQRDKPLLEEATQAANGIWERAREKHFRSLGHYATPRWVIRQDKRNVSVWAGMEIPEDSRLT